MARVWVPPNGDHLIEAYAAGASVLELSKECGVSRAAVGRFLERRGLHVRTRSDAARERWKKLDRAGTEALCGRAWQACTGRHPAMSERLMQAETLFKNQSSIRERELKMAQHLRKRGLALVHQLNVGPYNVDLAHEALRFVVEVQRGDLHRPTSMRRERIEYILNAGWDVIICYCPAGLKWGTRIRQEFDFAAVAEAVVAYADIARAQPSTRGRHGVIWRDGERGATLKADFDGLPRVPGF